MNDHQTPNPDLDAVRAVGAASVALHIIDNGGADPHLVLAKARTALIDGFNGRPRVSLQTCPAGQHEPWWATGENLPCPWCRIYALEETVASLQAPAGQLLRRDAS